MIINHNSSSFIFEFFSLKLNLYSVFSKKNFSYNLNNQILFFNVSKRWNYETKFKVSTHAGWQLEYYLFVWKLIKLNWIFSRIITRKLTKTFLIVAESVVFYHLISYITTKYNQQYIIGWIPGLVTNRWILKRTYMRRFKNIHLFGYTGAAVFTIIVENSSYKIYQLFKELLLGSTTFVFTFYSLFDQYLTECSFLTNKTELKIYFYLSIIFQLYFSTNKIDFIRK